MFVLVEVVVVVVVAVAYASTYDLFELLSFRKKLFNCI